MYLGRRPFLLVQSECVCVKGSEIKEEPGVGAAHAGASGLLGGLGFSNGREIENFWNLIFILKCSLQQLY